jgi:formylglycine-generating enzyme required for sulfatase activity
LLSCRNLRAETPAAFLEPFMQPIGGFIIDRNEVSVSQFKAFVDAAKPSPRPRARRRWQHTYEELAGTRKAGLARATAPATPREPAVH